MIFDTKRNETKRNETKLFDIAKVAARTEGFDGFGYADLAEEIGIRKTSIHHHFPTKADLSAAWMHRYHVKLDKASQRGSD